MRAARTAMRALVVVVFVTPLVLVTAGSLRDLGGPPPGGVELLPERAGFGAYRELARVLPLGTLVRNSLVVTAVAVPVTVAFATWAALGMCLVRDRSRRALVGATTVLLLVPVPTVWVARFVLYRWTGVLGTLVPLIAPAFAATSPFVVLLAYRALRRVPTDLWEAARLEGATPLRTWWSVAMPLIRPTTAAIVLIAFTAHWGNYLDALLYVQSPDHQTLAVGVAQLRDLDPTDAPVALAGATVLAAGPLALLALVQRRLFRAVGA